jgi:hypothetical protein
MPSGYAAPSFSGLARPPLGNGGPHRMNSRPGQASDRPPARGGFHPYQPEMDPMQYDIRHEAGEEFAALGRQIEDMTPEIAPHVEKVTALPLPSTVTIRIVTVPEWMRLWALHDERFLASEVEALSPTPHEVEQARAHLLLVREQHRTRAIGAQTVTYDGYASVVVLADNLREAGSIKSSTYLCNLIAHELTHVGQRTAGGEGYRLLTSTPFPQRRQLTGRAWPFVAEGYAVWAQEEVISRIHGDGQQPRSRPGQARAHSSRWRSGELSVHVMDHVMAAGATSAIGSAQSRKTLRWYAESGGAIGEVIASCGVEAVNRIWTRHDLLPTQAEEHDPLAWQRRLMGLPPATRGPGDFAAGILPGGGTRSVVVPPTPGPGRP